MKKVIISLVLVIGLMAFSEAAMALTFTLNPTQLAALYEVYENPSSAGTYLNPVQVLSNGAKYTGNIRTNDAGPVWGSIQIGANFWGQPFGGAAGTAPTNVSLGLGSLVGFDSYALNVENVNENAWKYNLYFNVGYTDSGESNYFVQNTWTTVPVASSSTIMLDFANAYVWGGTYNGELVNLSSITGLNLAHVTNIGLMIGQDVPMPKDDYTFETKVSPVPEPGSMMLLGTGLLGMIGYGKVRFGKKA